jgi:hypothetical protein
LSHVPLFEAFIQLQHEPDTLYKCVLLLMHHGADPDIPFVSPMFDAACCCLTDQGRGKPIYEMKRKLEKLHSEPPLPGTFFYILYSLYFLQHEFFSVCEGYVPAFVLPWTSVDELGLLIVSGGRSTSWPLWQGKGGLVIHSHERIYEFWFWIERGVIFGEKKKVQTGGV